MEGLEIGKAGLCPRVPMAHVLLYIARVLAAFNVGLGGSLFEAIHLSISLPVAVFQCWTRPRNSVPEAALGPSPGTFLGVARPKHSILRGLVDLVHQSRALSTAQWQVEWLGLYCRDRSLIKVQHSRCSLDRTRPIFSDRICCTVRNDASLTQVDSQTAALQRPSARIFILSI